MRALLHVSVLILLAQAAAAADPKPGPVRFVLMIDGQPAARFTSVRGLQPAKGGSITLTHGSRLNADLLRAWEHAGPGKSSPGVVLLSLGRNNSLLARYQLRNARPKTKTGGRPAALEELTIRHEGLRKLE